MNWKNLKLRTKFMIAFGSMIALLIVVAYWANNGIGNIVKDAGQVVEGNNLRSTLEKRYIDHLLWSNDLNELISDDDVTKLTVETDHHLCAFGKWYYGDGRKHAEDIAPELKPLFDKFEDPHAKLHQSAKQIQGIFIQGNRALSTNLRKLENKQLKWIHGIETALLNGESNINTMSEKGISSDFQEWLHSDEVAQLKQNNSNLRDELNTIENKFNELKSGMNNIEQYIEQGNISAAKQYYKNSILPVAANLQTSMEGIIHKNDEKLERMDKATHIYHSETQSHLSHMGELFNQAIEESKLHTMTDEVLLEDANNTRVGVIIFSVLAAIIGVILAVVIARGIIIPIKKGVAFAKEVAGGNLTSTVDVDQKDEIGDLANALKNMVNKLREIVENVVSGATNIASASEQMSSTSQEMSQGANEQASSVEEVSSSMEEMAANIQQNTDNAQQTEKIANKSADDVQEGNKSVSITVESMKNIADKITIVSEIARQTNILALNAAVEAARAGEHGKGFAVVAAEVRKLAERSQKAANEIEEVSKSSVIDAEKSGKILSEIVPHIQNNAKLMQEISAASLEQKSGADQINNAIQQLNNVTQQNAAASEELATSSEELSSQAEQLKEIIAFFKIDGEQKSGKEVASKKNNGLNLQNYNDIELVNSNNGNNGNNGEGKEKISSSKKQKYEPVYEKY